MDSNGRRDGNNFILSQALDQLALLFPCADPLFLRDATLTHLATKQQSSASTSTSPSGKGKGKASAADLSQTADELKAEIEKIVNRVVAKICEQNHGQYPSVIWKRKGRSTGESSRRTTGEAGKGNNLAEHPAVKKTWFLSSSSSSSVKEAGERRQPSPPGKLHDREVDEAMVRNLALVRLHTMFPETPISHLREVVAARKHSPLFDGVEVLLIDQELARQRAAQEPSVKSSDSPTAAWLFYQLGWKPKSASTDTTRPGLPALEPTDLFRSPEYFEALASHLEALYPAIPHSTISLTAYRSASYSDAVAKLAAWKSKPTLRFFSWFTGTLSTSSSSSSSTPDPVSAVSTSTDPILAQELESQRRLAAAESRLLQLHADTALARSLNAEWTAPENLFSCGCCFDDIPFEDVALCSTSEHFFCRTCVKRQVEEHVFGGAPLLPGGEVRCLSIEGCQAGFSSSTLERVLPRDLWEAFEDRVTEWLMVVKPVKGEKVLKCPFCPYWELEESRVLVRCLPIFDGASGDFVDNLVQTAFNLVVLFLLYTWSIVVISFFPDRFGDVVNSPTNSEIGPLFPLLEPLRTTQTAHRLIYMCGRNVINRREGRRNIFQCRNGPHHSPLPPFGSNLSGITTHTELVERLWGPPPDTAQWGKKTCGVTSCLECGKVWKEGGVHRCFEQGEEGEGLRLAVEKAMSEAVKRECPNCGLGFMKSEGCNKMTCRCGYIQCYCCRQQITDGYSHFCQHFRSVPGTPCTQCTKCSLWQNEDVDKVAAAAAQRARDIWLKEHPDTTVAVLSKVQIGPAARSALRDGLILRVEGWLEWMLFPRPPHR